MLLRLIAARGEVGRMYAVWPTMANVQRRRMAGGKMDAGNA